MNCKRFICYFMFGIYALLPGYVSADLYKYIDQTGTIVYTDDLAQVPLSQRENSLKIKEEIVPQNETPVPSAEGSPSAAGKPVNSNMSEEGAALQKEQTLLENEYRELSALNDQLEQEKALAKTRQEVSEFNIKADELNLKIEDYKKRQEAFIKKVNEYNQQLAGQ